jgi:TolB-like 6-blade propeller-like
MKSISNIFFLAIVVTTFTACNSDSKPIVYQNDKELLLYDGFPFRATLKGEKVGPKNYFMRPERCMFSNKNILVFDGKGELVIHLMNEDFELLDSFGKMGNGPNEFKESPLVWSHDFMSIDGFYTYNYGENKVCKRAVSSKGKIDRDSLSCFYLPKQCYNVQKVFVLGKDKMVGNGGMSEGKLYFFNPLIRDSVKVTDFYPKLNQDIDEEFKRYNFMGYMASNAVKEKIVFVNNYFNQIELYSLDGELIREIRQNNNLDDDVANGGRKNFYYYAVEMTDKYIYALYLGEENRNIVKSALGILKSKIHIFDLDGNPIAEIKLDRLVDDFFLNETKNSIYCLSGEDEERVFVKYILPTKLN